jgi:hypothetical protein
VRFLERRTFRENYQFRAGLLCAKWLVIGILLTVASHSNLWAQSFRAAASASIASGVTSFTVNKPTGTQENDVMIAAIAIRPYTATISPPSGWTLIRRTDNSNTNSLSQITYRKVAGSSEGTTYTWTLGNSPTGAAGGIMTFYGIDTTTPVNVENGQATPNSTSHSTPDVTTTVNNTMVVTAHSFTSSYYWSPPTGMTEAVDIANVTPPNQLGISIETNYVTQPSAGATGVKTATAPSGDPDAGVAQIVALTPGPYLTQPHYRWRNDDGAEQTGAATVAVNNVSTFSTSGTNKITTQSVSHTVSGTNRLLLVGVTLWPGASGNYVQSITWNGTALSNITSAIYSTSVRSELWKLVAPETGTYNVVVTLTGSPNQNTYCTIGVVSFTGVNQADPHRTAVTATGSSTSATLSSMTSASGEMVLSVAGAGVTIGANFNSFSGDTERWNLSTSTYTKGAGGTTAGATSVTVTHGLSASNGWAIIGLSIKPASLSAATFPRAEDSPLGVAKETPWRLRFLVSNGGGASSGSLQYQLQVAETATCSSGTYYAVGGSGDGADWAMAASANFADGDATSNISSGLTDPGGYSFVAGQLKDTSNQTGSITLAASNFTEIEYSIQAASGATTGGDYCFRLYNATGGSALNSYTYAEARVLGVTAIRLSSLRARTNGENVAIEWETGYEANNLGFHLYREENGELFRVTPQLVAGSAFLTGTGTPLTSGRSYTWIDASASQGLMTGPAERGLENHPRGTKTAALEDRPPEWGLRTGPADLEDHPAISGIRGKEKVLASSSEGTVLLPQGSKSRSLSHAEGMTVAYWLEDWDLSGKRTMHGPVTPVYSNKPLLKYGNATLLSDLGKRQNQKYDQFWRIQEIREGLLKDRPAERSLRIATLEDRPAEAGLEEHPRKAGLRGAAPKGGLEAVASNLKPQATSETERPSSVSGSAQRAIASQAAIKIGIREEGWYRITQPELVAAGLDPWGDPRRLRLFSDGKEHSLLVRGEGDGRFDASDSIEFYGTGQDTPFTDTCVYWLIEGTRPGKRIKTKQSRSWVAGAPSFPHTAYLKERNIYIAALKNADRENFFGAVVSPEGVDQILNITNLDPLAPGNAVLEVALQGGTTANHRVKVFVNDAEATEMQFEGMTRKAMSIALPHSWFIEGENLVSLVAQEGDADVSAVDYIHLTYQHTYTAEQDILRFTSSSGREVTLSGFTNPSVRVADITDPKQVHELTGVTVESEGTGYRVRFGAARNGKRTLLAFTEDVIKSPASIIPNQSSTWYAPTNSADLVIITHPDFIDSLGPLKSFRESQGLSVVIIDVQDLYDEFSFGAKTPQALKEFLRRAQTSWQGPPRFVLLVGDASFDPRNYLGLGDVDFVPTKLIDTEYLETASDDWFVDFKNNGLPVIPVGRIPVRTAEETALVVSKIISYENAEAGTWAQQAVMIADKKEVEDSFDFQQASAEVEVLLPDNITSQEIFRGQSDDGTTHTQIVDSINAGKLLVNYVGHGSVEFWRGGVFGSDDAGSLTNGTRLPFFITMTCLNGYFHDPYPTESLAESLLKAEGGGAIAVWASSGLTEPEGQSLMNKELILVLFDGTSRTLGESTMKAKSATDDQDVRRTWILFGDPTTRLKP